MRSFFGPKDADRVRDAEDGALAVDGRPFVPYVKQTLTYAVQMDEPFMVETPEGDHSGKKGDFLAIGIAGEMYPIDREVFETSYVPAEPL